MSFLLREQVENNDIDTNVMVQLFSPIVASQRIMFCQFDNSYTSIQLDDDLNFVFEEVSAVFIKAAFRKSEIEHSPIHLRFHFYFVQFLGFLFMSVGNEGAEYQQRYVGICISFIKHLCGPDIYL